MKLTDNIFAYHTFIYIRKKAKVNLELRVKEPAPPSPALSEFKKIFSHTRLKLPPLGFTSLTLSLYIFVKEPALLLKFVIPTFISDRVQKIFSHTRLKLPAFGVDFLNPEFIRFTFAFFVYITCHTQKC